MSLAALPMVAPWVLRNWLWLGNPAAPFLNRWFPNPFFSGRRTGLPRWLAHYPHGTHSWNIPIELTVMGGLVPGMVGPIFLLAPLGLLALRYSQGRRLLAAGALFAIPAYFNTEPRFLIPVLPFVALAMGMAATGGAACCPLWRFFNWCLLADGAFEVLRSYILALAVDSGTRGAAQTARNRIPPEPHSRVRAERTHRGLRAPR